MLFEVFVAADETERIGELISRLTHMGFACSIASDSENTLERVTEQEPDLMLIVMDSLPASSNGASLLKRIKEEHQLPVIGLISRRALDSLDSHLSMDDFVIEPWDATEVAARAKRTLQRAHNEDSKELIKCDDLVIDLAKCEVSINSRTVMLTFKEYELLRFLASNRGRVFSREALLNRVWGYDYYGGDRTIDVHVRRLRSKLEDANHTFIETVRNIGYRFKR